MNKNKLVSLITLGCILFLLSIYSIAKIKTMPSIPYQWVKLYYITFHVSILACSVLFFATIKTKFIAQTLSIIGLILLVLGLFSTSFIGVTPYQSLILIISLFSIGLGIAHNPSLTPKTSSLTMLLIALFSFAVARLYLSESFYLKLLVLAAGSVYLLTSVGLFKSRNWAKISSFYCATILLICFIPYSLFICFENTGWGIVMALTFLPFVASSIFFLFVLKKIKA